jgi:hypothetical protein
MKDLNEKRRNAKLEMVLPEMNNVKYKINVVK